MTFAKWVSKNGLITRSRPFSFDNWDHIELAERVLYGSKQSLKTLENDFMFEPDTVLNYLGALPLTPISKEFLLTNDDGTALYAAFVAENDWTVKTLIRGKKYPPELIECLRSVANESRRLT